MNIDESILSRFLLLVHFYLAQSDYAPYFYDNGPHSNNGNLALFSLSEDTPKGTHIYILNGTDPEGWTVRYGLGFDPGAKEYFRVDPISGIVTLIEELDREIQDEIEVLVSISDEFNKIVEKVRVYVTDANDEAPQFGNLPSNVDVPESTPSGRSIFKVQAVDKDTGSGGSVTYFLQSTGPNTKFAIDHHSGVLRIKESLDYETVRTHFLTVVAKDGGGSYNGREQVLSSSATLTINVIDSQDTPPSFVGAPYFGYVYEVSSPGSEIFTVYAKDGDVEAPNPIVYSIESGADGIFGINKTSGCITLLVYPDNLRKEIFNIKVKASEVNTQGSVIDFALTTVTIRVVDLNNHHPTFYGETGPQDTFELTMYEHPPEGEILRGLRITVNDSDQGANAKFNLRLVGPGHMLRLVPQTVLNEAQVTLLVEDSTAIDYEKFQFLTFKILAVEIDTPERFSATADIVIHLLDTNDNAPRFSSDFYIARIPENSPGGSNVVSVTAKDPDSGLWGVVKYSIHGSGSDLFFIQSDSGIIYTQPWASLDAEAVDDDAEEPNNVIEYSIMKAEPDNIFDINAETGEIKLKPYIKSMDIVHNITNQKDCTWSVVVQARDRGSPSFSTTTLVKIDIIEATQLNDPLASFLMKRRENPMQILGMLATVIIALVFVTVLISTAIFMRNKKSNKILPSRRIIKKKHRQCKQWNFYNPFKQQNNSERFMKESEVPENVNCNNNSVGVHHSPPLPPPLPGFLRRADRPWAVPTVSAPMAKQKSFRNKQSHVNTALVSELKLRLEQKKLINQY
ncbi:cadherin-related family member 1 isoform X2 [Tachysurus vachellii]|uniref:cadherin-related family member 1 isoform X2 n=1 Tax=Tachysurus vachellii TaxID=175792 RepID=UPI00296B33C7|nr:cadherin-related family member 1 isoform X2 [Tachysurus vachellii]